MQRENNGTDDLVNFVPLKLLAHLKTQTAASARS